jgi:hypothetical protein
VAAHSLKSRPKPSASSNPASQRTKSGSQWARIMGHHRSSRIFPPRKDRRMGLALRHGGDGDGGESIQPAKRSRLSINSPARARAMLAGETAQMFLQPARHCTCTLLPGCRSALPAANAPPAPAGMDGHDRG